MKLSLEHYTNVTAWNYDHTNDKACLSVVGLNNATSVNMTPDEMEALAFELQTSARVCRERIEAINTATA